METAFVATNALLDEIKKLNRVGVKVSRNLENLEKMHLLNIFSFHKKIDEVREAQKGQTR